MWWKEVVYHTVWIDDSKCILTTEYSGPQHVLSLPILERVDAVDALIIFGSLFGELSISLIALIPSTKI